MDGCEGGGGRKRERGIRRSIKMRDERSGWKVDEGERVRRV